MKPQGVRLRATNILAAIALAAGLAGSASPALAHPHVWVTASATVLYAHNAITGLQQAWTFDEFYTQQAIEGLDKNGDGKYDRQELQELAQVNIYGLKEFAYFTNAKLGADESEAGQERAFGKVGLKKPKQKARKQLGKAPK